MALGFATRKHPPRRAARAALAAGPLLALLAACATPPPPSPVHRGDAVALRVDRDPSPDAATPIQNLSLGPSASTGSGAGAVAGGLWGLSCGPLAILCVPLGVGFGAVTGLGGGAVVGLASALPAEEATPLRERFGRVVASHDLVQELRVVLTRRASKVWDLNATQPVYGLHVQLGSLALTSTRERDIGLVMAVSAQLRRSDDPAAPVLRTKPFRCAPPPSSLAVWLDERSDYLDAMLTLCIEQLAAQLIADFTAP